MIVNNTGLLVAAPIKNMVQEKYQDHGVSYGLSEAGYDIRLAQTINFTAPKWEKKRWFQCQRLTEPFVASLDPVTRKRLHGRGRFILASAMEEFQMPTNLVGKVHDKSTWARQGISVFNTVIEPGWEGFLTLEIVFHGNQDLIIPAGSGIAQVLFFETKEHSRYAGKYQHQQNRPVESIFA